MLGFLRPHLFLQFRGHIDHIQYGVVRIYLAVESLIIYGYMYGDTFQAIRENINLHKLPVSIICTQLTKTCFIVAKGRKSLELVPVGRGGSK